MPALLPKKGVMLTNLGSPDDCDEASVRRYLNEFLMDPFVLASPWLIRRFIVSAFILPSRPRHTSAAYRSIWRDEAPGSPLIHHSYELARRLRGQIEMPVSVGMRYGSPDLQSAINALGDVDEIFLIPLYPQHADSTRTTTIERMKSLTRVPIRVMPPFYQDEAFLDAMKEQIAATMKTGDYLLFSYHGLPNRHLEKADPTGSHCLSSEHCCSESSAAHETCYRHQCLATTQSLAARLAIDEYGVSFQSRRGRQPWIEPFTDEVLADLPGQGIDRLTVVCPAFTADNLETLEEIGMRGRDTFIRAGGEEFRLVPSLNHGDAWVRAIANWCEQGA